jgi:hypothetical protein
MTKAQRYRIAALYGASVVLFVVGMIRAAAIGRPTPAVGVLTLALQVAAVAYLAVARGRSPWWALLGLLNVVGFLGALFLKDRKGADAVGGAPITGSSSITGSSPITRSSSIATAPFEPPPFFELSRPPDGGSCGHPGCPCSKAALARGTGYLHVTPETVRFRSDARTAADAAAKQRLMEGSKVRALGLSGDAFAGRSDADLVCEKGARLRGLDLQTAAADAVLWWETGLAPLRPTPLHG